MIRLALAFLLAWQLAVWAFGIPRFLLPGPWPWAAPCWGRPTCWPAPR
ncbi:hypothetical protein ACFSYD_26420 [Paracoccus aerius]